MIAPRIPAALALRSEEEEEEEEEAVFIRGERRRRWSLLVKIRLLIGQPTH